jgi:hypothetical protein
VWSFGAPEGLPSVSLFGAPERPAYRPGDPLRTPARVEVLRSLGGLPPHLVGMFEEPADFQQASTGLYYVFDRRGHTVWTVDPDRTLARKAVTIGGEAGRILEPLGFDVASDGTFVVADVPRSYERVQTFDAAGTWKTGFFLQARRSAGVTIGGVVLNGIGSIQHTGHSVLVSAPDSGALFTEYSLTGGALRSIGRLRPTGYEREPDLHVAMNAGFPLVDPAGGYYFVFMAGQPMFRKYDGSGTLMFERHIEGREIDDLVANQPAQWPRRVVDDREIPFVSPVVRAAAVDGKGQLWVAMAPSFTYVYDRDGDKLRTIQFSAAGIINPTSLSFTPAGRLLVTPGCYEFDPS